MSVAITLARPQPLPQLLLLQQPLQQQQELQLQLQQLHRLLPLQPQEECKMEIFPDSMKPSSEMTLEGIAEKFDFFFRQIHLLHLQTSSYAEHKALQIWDTMPDLKDEFLEKLSGYEGRKVKSYKASPITDYSIGFSTRVITDLRVFAQQLESYGRTKNYPDIENLAQSLNGSASQVLYLLTLS